MKTASLKALFVLSAIAAVGMIGGCGQDAAPAPPAAPAVTSSTAPGTAAKPKGGGMLEAMPMGPGAQTDMSGGLGKKK